MAKAEVDRYFPRNGPCMFHSTRYARHRLVDVIRDRHLAGEPLAALHRDFPHLSMAAIRAAAASSPDDNRMTKREIKEGREDWERAFPSGEVKRGEK